MMLLASRRWVLNVVTSRARSLGFCCCLVFESLLDDIMLSHW